MYLWAMFCLDVLHLTKHSLKGPDDIIDYMHMFVGLVHFCFSVVEVCLMLILAMLLINII